MGGKKGKPRPPLEGVGVEAARHGTFILDFKRDPLASFQVTVFVLGRVYALLNYSRILGAHTRAPPAAGREFTLVLIKK